jgi:hypothetical protein
VIRARLRPVALVLLVATVGLSMSACGDDGDGSAGDGVAAPPVSTTLPTLGYTTTPVSVPSPERGLLTNVTATKAAPHTRVIFEFREGMPGYKVDYGQRPVVQDGSGDEVNIEGDELLIVRFEPASGFDLEARRGGQPTYTGPKRIAVGGNSDPVREVVQVGDFEAVLTWAIGLNGKRPFRVTTATDPSALVVDVKALEG